MSFKSGVYWQALPALALATAFLFAVSDKALVAELGAETLNRNFRAVPAQTRPFTERYPEVLWVALLAVIAVLGVVALKSSRNAGL